MRMVWNPSSRSLSEREKEESLYRYGKRGDFCGYRSKCTVGREAQFIRGRTYKTAFPSSYFQSIVVQYSNSKKGLLIGNGVTDIGIGAICLRSISFGGKIFSQPAIGHTVEIPIPDLIFLNDMINMIMTVNRHNQISISLCFLAKQLVQEVVIMNGIQLIMKALMGEDHHWPLNLVQLIFQPIQLLWVQPGKFIAFTGKIVPVVIGVKDTTAVPVPVSVQYDEMEAIGGK